MVLFTDRDGNMEGAIDDGGPTRELFRLVMAALRDGKLFEGPEERKNLAFSYMSLMTKDYYYAGVLIALSLIHGGGGPHFFSLTLCKWLLSGDEDVQPVMDDVADPDMKTELETIRDATDLDSYREAILKSSLMGLAGFHNMTFDIDRKVSVVEGAIKFYTIYRVQPAFKQFKNGLNEANLLDHLKRFPSEFEELFCFRPKDAQLTASSMRRLFSIIFSANSHAASLQHRAISFFWSYLDQCDGDNAEVTLKKLLSFFTGSEVIPPLGFATQPVIVFREDDAGNMFPLAHTCDFKLELPVCHATYNDFEYYMNFGIVNSLSAFGFI